MTTHNHVHQWTVRTSRGAGRILIDNKVILANGGPVLFDTLTPSLVQAYLKNLVTITPDPIQEGILILDGVMPATPSVEVTGWKLATSAPTTCQDPKQPTNQPMTWHLIGS